MATQQQLQLLEARLIELLDISARLKRENQALHSRENKLLDERAQLMKKNDLAKAQVEAIISRLRSLEQDS